MNLISNQWEMGCQYINMTNWMWFIWQVKCPVLMSLVLTVWLLVSRKVADYFYLYIAMKMIYNWLQWWLPMVVLLFKIADTWFSCFYVYKCSFIIYNYIYLDAIHI